MGNIIVKSFDARKSMLRGMTEAANTVVDTFGPRGKTIAYQKGSDTILTKDGITVLKNIKFSDELKDTGAKLLKEASEKANFHNGDGSSTTAILTMALCKAMNELIDRGFDINLVRDSMTEMRDFIFEQLPNYRNNIEDEQTLKDIALISSNNDEELANLITEAFTSIGDKGLVSYSSSKSRYGESFVQISEGCEIEKGFVSYKCINAPNNQCILEDVKVAIFKESIEDLDSFKLFMQMMNKFNLLVIAPDYSHEVLSAYVESWAKNNKVFIRTPGYSVESINRNAEDLAVIFNTKVIGEKLKFEEASWSTCGGAEKIIATKDNVIVTNPSTDKESMDEYIKLLENLITIQDPSMALSQNEIDNIKLRIAKMTGGIATIYVGAILEQELQERLDRTDDAVNAVRNALKEGFVTGGGTTLYRIANSEEFEAFSKDVASDKKVVYNVFARAIETPLKLLIKSAGQSSDRVAIKLAENKNYGFNARTGEIEDLSKKGIVDPYLVVKNSILYSTNMAMQFISIADVICSDVKNLSIEALDDVVDPGRGVFGDF